MMEVKSLKSCSHRKSLRGARALTLQGVLVQIKRRQGQIGAKEVIIIGFFGFHDEIPIGKIIALAFVWDRNLPLFVRVPY